MSFFTGKYLYLYINKKFPKRATKEHKFGIRRNQKAKTKGNMNNTYKQLERIQRKTKQNAIPPIRSKLEFENENHPQ